LSEFRSKQGNVSREVRFELTTSKQVVYANILGCV